MRFVRPARRAMSGRRAGIAMQGTAPKTTTHLLKNLKTKMMVPLFMILSIVTDVACLPSRVQGSSVSSMYPTLSQHLLSTHSPYSSRCPNYDLCESCAEAGIHPAEHRLLRFEMPEGVNKYLRDDGIVSSFSATSPNPHNC